MSGNEFEFRHCQALRLPLRVKGRRSGLLGPPRLYPRKQTFLFIYEYALAKKAGPPEGRRSVAQTDAMSLLQRRLGEPVGNGAQRVSAVCARALRLLEHGELPVGGSTAADDRAAMLDLVEAIENLRVVANVLEHLVEQIGDR